MAGRELRRTKVEGVLGTVGEVMVPIAPRIGQGDRAQATEAKERSNVGGGAGEQEDGRLITTGWTRQTVAKEGGGLQGEGVECGREVGGTQEDTRGGKHGAPKALNVRILLRRVGAGEAKLDLPIIEKFAEVPGHEG